MTTDTFELAPIPVLPLRSAVLLPGETMPLDVGRPQSRKAVDAALAGNGRLFVVPQLDPSVDIPVVSDLLPVGVEAEVVRAAPMAKRQYTIVVRGLHRVHLDKFIQVVPYPTAVPTPVDVSEEPSEDLEDAVDTTREMLATVVEASESDEPESLRARVEDIDTADELADFTAARLELDRDMRLMLLGEPDPGARLDLLDEPLSRAVEVLELRTAIREEVVDAVTREQREEVLRARMRAIQSELGEDAENPELDELEDMVLGAAMPDEVRAVAKKQLRRLRDMSSQSPEYTIQRTYLERLAALPWGVESGDSISVTEARDILEADHDGLGDVKKRVLEFIAVRKLVPDKAGPILCLVGPPGVGKTSLGRSIARALGREYVRISLGGVRDEAEIRGHRRTYVGALPGRIASAVEKAGTMNPVFVLDEIDKLVSDGRGDPSAAMLEVLDPEQNSEFVDHYLEVPLDLSKVMFIATANRLDTIPGPLLDRMEVIRIPGYTDEEKLAIARNHLVPRQIEEHGLKDHQVAITDGALREVIRNYTREAGVRNLEREIGAIARHAAVAAAGDAPFVRVDVDARDVGAILGPARFSRDEAEQASAVGVVAGLSWTPVGGELLFIEARTMPGRGNLKVTGQLGDVMSESVTAAYSWVRSNAAAFGIEPDAFATVDLHVHAPAGAIKKDGPSAGVAMATAIASVYTNKPIRHDVAITGEITLRGYVLPVGGIKEKVLAAHRAGVKIVILPERNRKDILDIPEQVRDELDIRFVKRVNEALSIALGDPGEEVERDALVGNELPDHAVERDEVKLPVEILPE